MSYLVDELGLFVYSYIKIIIVIRVIMIMITGSFDHFNTS